DQTYNEFKIMQRFCDSLNIDLYIAVGPDKASIYPDQLPIKPLDVGKTKRIIKEKLKQKDDICIIDMSDYFSFSKDSNLFYYKTDSHWNNNGAYWGTLRLLDEIRKKHDVGKISLNDYQSIDTTVYKMDLSRQIDVDMKETYSILRNKSSKYKKKRYYTRYGEQNIPIDKTENLINSTKCIVFCDSFFSNMFDFFCDNVGFVTIGVQRFDKELILKERPDFIVVEIVERRLLGYDRNEFYL
ncbi:hypothetical protein LJC00_03825, partial [Dysgonomonas sp. OttesenSCG-928-M03]|nr:hypothetical protein [Dysgonomonas sp. OttesenSCG-928-M03]